MWCTHALACLLDAVHQDPPLLAMECLSQLLSAASRRGVASGLLKAAAQLCQQSGYARMFLHIQAGDSAAEALYLKSGFQICKTEPRSLVQRLQSTEPRKLLVQSLFPEA